MKEQIITGLDTKSGRGLALTVADGVITRIEERAGADALFVSPGLIDLQVNGFGGFDANAADVTPHTIRDLAGVMLRSGVTTFAPTVITASEKSIRGALQAIYQARRMWPHLAAIIPYVHVEGPHISPEEGYRGAHPAEHVRPPSIAEFMRWQEACDGLVGLVTMSPHYEESAGYIAALSAQGVHVAIGHTHASAAQIRVAVGAGATISTHLGNGIAAVLQRHENPLWPQLAEERLTASFIADGHHLPADVLASMLRAKGAQRAMLVSDAVALAGMPAGVYATPVGRRVELKPDGRLCIAGSELLAGATASLADGIANVVCTLGVPMHEALALATAVPGQFTAGRGRLEVGARADLLRFRWKNKIVIEEVWLAGEQVFAREAMEANECDA